MSKFRIFTAAVALSALVTTGSAEGYAADWKLDPALSNVSFGSIKDDYFGESHTFGEMSGTVTADGTVTIVLGLASLETMIDIRNERMVEYLFQDAPSAIITAEIDMAELTGLATGEAITIQTFGTLSLLGVDTDLDVSFFVMRLNDAQVLVTTNGILMLSTEDAGFDVGIDKLQELANLDSITRVSPVTMRMVFNAGP